MLHLTTAMIAAIFLASSISFANDILSVEPDFIKMRHSASVKVKIKAMKEDMHLSLIPGGAYIKKTKTTSALAFLHNKLLIDIEQSSQLIIYQSNKANWQEVGFLELSTPDKASIPTAIYGFDTQLFVVTADELIEISISKVSSPRIINRKPLAKKIKHFSAGESHHCTIEENQLSLFKNQMNKPVATRSIHNSVTQLLTYKDHCISLSSDKGIQVWEIKEDKLVLVSSYIPDHIAQQIILSGNLLSVANGTTGITLLKITSNKKINWLGSYNKLGNIIRVARSGQHLVAADDKGVLSVFDIENPATPLLISDFHTHQSITAMQLEKDQAYILANRLTDSSTKISTASVFGKMAFNIDFKSKSSPMISTLGVNQGGSRRSFIENDILYVADWFSGLHLYDIRNPFAPRLLSSFHTPGSPKGVVVRNGIAFVADDDHGLQIINVSNPREPVFVSEIPLSGLAYTMKLIDNLLYIASHRGGFHIVDVSKPEKPILISTYDTPGKAWALEYKNGLLYVADDSTGLMVFDVKDSTRPALISQFNPGGFAEDVILKNNKAYVAFFDLGLFILDITDPQNLKQLANISTPGNARGIEIKENLLYLASWEAGVQLIDISNDHAPKMIGHYDTKGAVWGLSVQNKIIYAMDWWGGIKILDAKKAEDPYLISQYQTAGVINDLKYDRKFLYTAHGSRGFQVYDATNDLNPIWATGVDIEGDAKAISINKNLAIVAAGDGGVVIIDINNPFQARAIGQLKLDSSISFVQSDRNVVFAAEENGDLYFIDITNPAKPRLLKRVSLATNSISVNDNKLFVLHNNQTVSSFSVNKLTDFELLREYNPSKVSDDLQFINATTFILKSHNQLSACSINQTSIVCKKSISLPNELVAMHFANELLYASTKNSELYVFTISENNLIELNTIYPTSHQLTRISTSKDGIFFGGESVIASGTLLPRLSTERINGQFMINIPDNMPKGAYHLALTRADGSQEIKKNAVTIGFPKLKSKFTLEQLKEIMKQKNFEGKAPVPQN
ncbi:MAG: hypothetical protein OEX07_00915 [Gammaproteobacteria bacterium]|nr:hypothetical protein [Gammaproteobacteria bacterium]